MTRLEVGLFTYCSSLTNIIIPSKVTSIESGVFAGCTGLKSIYCNAVTPPACDDSAFDEDKNCDCPLYVPKESIGAYKVANVWKDFWTIKENTNASALETMTTTDTQNAPLYNLQGQKVVTPQRGGIYMSKDKKVIVR